MGTRFLCLLFKFLVLLHFDTVVDVFPASVSQNDSSVVGLACFRGVELLHIRLAGFKERGGNLRGKSGLAFLEKAISKNGRLSESLSEFSRGHGSTFRAIRKNKPLWMFMLAFFFYIDAVNTVISMSTSYGAELGIDSTQLVVALLVTQFVAFPCAILYGRMAGRFGCKAMIVAAVVAYMCIVFFAAFFLVSAAQFWILAILVGMFQGGIQALSRSYYGKIIPKDHANEYYGFYDIFGKIGRAHV